MFKFLKEIRDLKEQITSYRGRVLILETDKDNQRENILKETTLLVDQKLIDFKTEMNNLYFEIMEKIFRLNRDLALANTLVTNVNQQDIKKLKDEIENQILNIKWKKDQVTLGDKIINKGENIVLKRKELWDLALKMEREGKPFKEIEDIKSQIKAFDWILKEIK